MREKIIKFLDRILVPQWIIFCFDVAMISFGFMFTYLLRYNLVSSAVDIPKMLLQLVASFPFFLLSYGWVKPHIGVLRNTTVRDAWIVLYFLGIYTLGLGFISNIGTLFWPPLQIPFSVIIIQFFIGIFLLVGFRFLITYLWRRLVKKPETEMSMMIYGAGSMGQITKHVIEKDDALHYKLVGFIDDNPGLQGKRIDGMRVYSSEEAFSKIIEEKKVKEIVIGIKPELLSKEKKQDFVNLCINRNIRVKDVPNVPDWLDERFSANQIHDVLIEDLLGRNAIFIDDKEVRKGVYRKKILVTGAAGSIGSEIVRQLSEFWPGEICLLDQAESSLNDLYNEISSKNPEINLRVMVADVTNSYRMRQIFRNCTPDIIFHASAYKHVPLMEQQPYEALRTNVMGTKIVADLAVEYGVKKFVMVSTDKAVNPTNVMGASKMICEMYCHSLSRQPGVTTRFITTRFGNVLGSNGSVIPLFRRQISQGGPVTVTDREIIRYFMTIPEASRLVLEAGFMGNGGDVFLFDMGQPVKIYDLAEKMIRLSGFIPHKEIRIVETGLRPGEKLYEEMLANNEETLPTHNEKILIAKLKSYDFKATLSRINDLVAHLDLEDEKELVARMKDILPEYKSQNSWFEVLDHQPSSKN